MQRVFAVSAVLTIGLLAACLDERFPGEQVMGTFEFTATPRSLDCNFDEVSDGGFRFEGTFSRGEEGTPVWLTLQGVNRDAGFDGQVADSLHEAPRQFQDCACETTKVRETLRVALLSETQLQAAKEGPLRNPDGGDCPVEVLDGGIPAGEGIATPNMRDDGTFDAERACGELLEEIVPGEGCRCAPCTLTYDVIGISRN